METVFVLILFVAALIVFYAYHRELVSRELFTKAVNYIKNGETSPILTCLCNGLNINARDGKGKTLLHYASEENNEETVSFLIMHGALINAKNASGHTALDESVEWGREKSAYCLINSGANIHQKDNNGDTIFHRIASQNNVRLYKHILESEKNPSAKLREYVNDLIANCKKTNNIISELLIQKGADYNEKNNQGLTVLDCAAHSMYANLVKRLLDLDASFSSNSYESLCSTVSYAGDCKNIRLLANKGITFPDYSILLASASGHTMAVEELIATGDVDIDFQNEKGCSSLMLACGDENIAMVKLLLEKGANVNLGDAKGFTALHIACGVGAVNIVSLLLSHGADPNRIADNLYPPLKVECMKNQEAVEALLILAGAQKGD